MLSDPVAEAFGLIHRHPSGENFWHGMAETIDRDQDAKAPPLEELCQLRIITVYTSFLVRQRMVRLECHMLMCYVSMRSLIQRLGLDQAQTRSRVLARPMNCQTAETVNIMNKWNC